MSEGCGRLPIMSGDESVDTAGLPDAQGTPWSESEDARLVAALIAGDSVNDIATAHRRSRGAITSRMERMVPPAGSLWSGGQVPMAGSGRRTWLVQQLQAGDYPWEQVLAGKTRNPAGDTAAAGRTSTQQPAPVEASAAGPAAGEGSGIDDEPHALEEQAEVDSSSRSSLGRAYESWSEPEYVRLVAGLRAGLPLSDIAADLQRKESALRTQAARMVPADAPLEGSKTRRLDWLREQLLADADYDWRTPLRANSDGPVWLGDDDAELTEGWRSSTSLPQLATRFGCSEMLIVRRLLTLRLAASTVEVVERLGCTPGGTVQTHYLLATDAARAQLQVLVGTEAPGGGATVHLSVHSSTAEAIERAAKVDQIRARTDQAPLHWLTGERRVGLPYDESELHPLGDVPPESMA